MAQKDQIDDLAICVIQKLAGRIIVLDHLFETYRLEELKERRLIKVSDQRFLEDNPSAEKKLRSLVAKAGF